METATRETTLLFALAAGLIALVITGNGLICLTVFGLVVLLVVGWQREWWHGCGRVVGRMGSGLLVLWRTWWASKEEAGPEFELYDLLMGYDPETTDRDIENLADLGHVGIYGTTRYGKTTWIHSAIHHLISTHHPSELRLAISDPKTVDYPFYGSLPYLLCPIARDRMETGWMVDRLIAEMNRRIALFAPYAAKSICNNIDRYAELSGERLPRVVAIFDELADVVEPGSELEQKLIRLAKLSLAYGIQLFCATQRPSAKVMNGEIKSQFSSLMVTFMPNNREYGTVAMAPKELYEQMTRTRGRFMVYSAKGWRFVQGYKVPDRQLERLAAKLSGRAREWHVNGEERDARPQSAIPASSAWPETDAEKVRVVVELGREMRRRPSINETASRFGISRPTAIKYLNLAFNGE